MMTATRKFNMRVEGTPRYSAGEFTGFLRALIQGRGIDAGELLSTALIDAPRGYKLISGSLEPTRGEVLRLAVALGCDRREAALLLRFSGQRPLCAQVKRDAAILFCIEQKKAVSECRAFLRSNGLPPI